MTAWKLTQKQSGCRTSSLVVFAQITASHWSEISFPGSRDRSSAHARDEPYETNQRSLGVAFYNVHIIKKILFYCKAIRRNLSNHSVSLIISLSGVLTRQIAFVHLQRFPHSVGQKCLTLRMAPGFPGGGVAASDKRATPPGFRADFFFRYLLEIFLQSL